MMFVRKMVKIRKSPLFENSPEIPSGYETIYTFVANMSQVLPKFVEAWTQVEDDPQAIV